MEKFSVPSNDPAKVLESLRQTFLSGELSPEDFMDKILELDQADPERTSSLRAAELLSQPEIVAAFEGIEERTNFYSIRSLTFFHKAQIRLSKGELNVQDDLKKALHDSEESGPENTDWANYIRATIAYLANDLDSLRELSGKLDLNKSLVQNFVKGLEERGYPDYVTDYGKERESE